MGGGGGVGVGVTNACTCICTYMPYFSGAILGFSENFSGTNDIFLGQILQNSVTLSGTF